MRGSVCGLSLAVLLLVSAAVAVPPQQVPLSLMRAAAEAGISDDLDSGKVGVREQPAAAAVAADAGAADTGAGAVDGAADGEVSTRACYNWSCNYACRQLGYYRGICSGSTCWCYRY